MNHKQSRHLPTFSIVVPTYKRPERLIACLRSLAELDYPRHRFEVIVVDDGSESPPKALVASFHDRLDVTLLAQPHTGPAGARIAGAVRARGEFLAFTDDDCAPAPDWLSALAARLAVKPEHLVGGQTLNALPDNCYSSASQLLIAYLYAYYNTPSGEARFFASNNMALPAEGFRTVGGFDTTFPRAAAEDREFCDRWRHYGYRMAYAPAAVVYHTHALTLPTFWRQHFNYGRGAWRFHRIRARRRQQPARVEPLSFYLDMLRFPLAQTQGRRAWALVALLVMSQVANAAGFFWQSFSSKIGSGDLKE